MGTAFVKKSKAKNWLFAKRDRLILCGRGYVVESRTGSGAFGEVYTVLPCDGSHTLRVVKFLRNFDEFKHGESVATAAQISANLVAMFKREGEYLKQMSSKVPSCFPAFYGSGIYAGHNYYLMEHLAPVGVSDLRLLDSDARRMEFIGDLCRAVAALHENGLVHFDIKPSNLLIRKGKGTYVLGDFGSVHLEERHKRRCEKDGKDAQTLSMLSDGRRITPRTIGYCDPIDSLHTRHADIYAIGQVIRDLFADEVPALWARIILKCINRNFGQRYDSAEQVLEDVMSMGGSGASKLAREMAEIMAPGGSAWLRERKTIHVAAGAKPCGNGTESRPYRTIAAALENAESDSRIEVHAGEYREVLVLQGRKVDLVAVDGPQKTVILGKRGFPVVRITDGADNSLVKGFTITGGTGLACESSYGHDYYGGGINANVSATVEDCVITGNGQGVPKKSSCTFGGGAFVSCATVTFRNCRICDNYAWASGGGLMAADGYGPALVLVGCTIEDNDSSEFFGVQGGVGLANLATLSVSGCVVAGNAGDQIGAYGSVHANGTRAQVEKSYIEGGAKACNIQLFIDRKDNFAKRPSKNQECGCKDDIIAPLFTGERTIQQ